VVSTGAFVNDGVEIARRAVALTENLANLSGHTVSISPIGLAWAGVDIFIPVVVPSLTKMLICIILHRVVCPEASFCLFTGDDAADPQGILGVHSSGSEGG